MQIIKIIKKKKKNLQIDINHKNRKKKKKKNLKININHANHANHKNQKKKKKIQNRYKS